MLREEVIFTNTPWQPGPVAAISSAPSPASHPFTMRTLPNTYTHTPSHTSDAFIHPPPPPPPPPLLSPGLPVTQLQPSAVLPRRSCVTWRSVASSGEAKSLCGPLLPLPPWGVTGKQSAARIGKLPPIFCG